MIGMSQIQRLMYITSRLETVDSAGQSYTGTGFFYLLELDETSTQVPLLVTNRHVVKDMKSLHATLARVSLDGKPLLGEYIDINVDCLNDDTIYMHPDGNIDLAIIDLRPYLQGRSQNDYFRDFLKKTDTVTSIDLQRMHVIQEIVMIGYPDAIYDSVHNLPIFRRGVAATDPAIDYEGEKSFLIDASCFPGSSGSPVFSYENGTWAVDEEGFLHYYSGLILMGILSAGYHHLIDGKINELESVQSDMPNNLGIVIKASCLDDFKTFFEEISRR